MRKPLFVTSQASYFNIKKRSKVHVFSKPFLGPPFSHFFRFVFTSGRFGDPFKIRWVSKCPPISPKRCQKGTREFTARLPGTIPETTLRPRRRLKRPRSYFSWLLKDLVTFQVSCWRFFNDYWRRFLYWILVFAQTARHQKQCRTLAEIVQETSKE